MAGTREEDDQTVRDPFGSDNGDGGGNAFGGIPSLKSGCCLPARPALISSKVCWEILSESASAVSQKWIALCSVQK